MTPSICATETAVHRVADLQTIADVERELWAIEDRSPRYLQMPAMPGQWQFGAEAAFLQYLITWGRRHPKATLVTHLTEDEDPTGPLLQLVKRPIGFVGAWMARDVTDRSVSRYLKRQANHAAEAVFDWMWRDRREPRRVEEPSLWAEGEEDRWEAPSMCPRGTRVFLASIDHHPQWRIPQCYFQTGEVRHRDDFTSLAEAIARYATSDKGTTAIAPEVRKPLAVIVHELFKNTHEWARTNSFGGSLLRSARGLLAQGHSWAQTEAREAAEGSAALGEYLGHPPFWREQEYRQFLELSVFDSGIGLARRWLSGRADGEVNLTNCSLDGEYEACVNCFLRWGSSRWESYKGLGLHEVMQALSGLGAFFRVRTGRLSLYRNFVAQPYTETAAAGSRLFADWSAQWESLTALAPAEGTLYTMLIPVTQPLG